MHRTLRTFALLSPSIRSGRNISDPIAKSIYSKFKNAGFKETPWQYIYDGQLAGLVKPVGIGLNEIHIRFYEDRYFAEIEIGRGLIAHFFGPQFSASTQVRHFARDFLSDEEFTYLETMLAGELRDDELAITKRCIELNDPYCQFAAGLRSPRIGRHFAGVSWRTLTFALIPIISLSTIPDLQLSTALLIAICSALVGLTLPSVGRP